MASEATERLQLRGTTIGWPLEELWVSGAFLSDSPDVDDGVILLRLDLPAEDVPWLALHPKGEAVGELLRLGKRPFSWWYRSIEDPPWNIKHQRVVRFWSAAAGTDVQGVERLAAGDVAALDIVSPTHEEFAAQVDRDLERSRAHLRQVVDGYWERDWRREHRQGEEDLWRAAAAICALEDAVQLPPA